MRLDAGIWIQLGNSALALAVAVGVGTLGAEWIRQQTLKLPQPAPVQTLKPAPPPEDRGKGQQAFAPILDQNVFRAQKQEAPLPPPPPVVVQQEQPTESQALPRTNLNVALTGTMIFGPRNAFAFISPRNQLGNYRIFELGECFDPNTVAPSICTPGTVQVLEVMDREVVLVFRDQKQRLLMEEAEGTAPSNTETRSQKAPQTTALVVPPASSKPALPKPPPPAASSEKPPPASEGQTTFNFTRSWVDEQLANFNQILMDARVVATETEPPRFMFKYIKKGSLYEQLGLKTNDVILEVNGFVIDSLPKALKLMETLQAEREIALKVEREDTPIVFNYYID